MSQNQQLLHSFTSYCKAYPELRFWQALRNWSANGNFLVFMDEMPNGTTERDTFYWRGRFGSED